MMKHTSLLYLKAIHTIKAITIHTSIESILLLTEKTDSV